MSDNYPGFVYRVSLKNASFTEETVYAVDSRAAESMLRARYGANLTNLVFRERLPSARELRQRDDEIRRQRERDEESRRRQEERKIEEKREEAEKRIKAQEQRLKELERKSNNDSSYSYSSSSSSSSTTSSTDDSGFGFIKAIITIGIIYGLYILFSNLMHISTIKNYDFGLYFSNIKHFNSTGSKELANKNYTVYLTMPDELVGKTSDIHKNKVVIYNGYKNLDNNKTMTAVSFYENNNKVYGYIETSKDASPLKEINDKMEKYIENKIRIMFKHALESKIKLYELHTDKEAEKYEKDGYKKIDKLSTGNAYVYKQEDENTVEQIENEYYDDKAYEKLFFEIGNKYYK